MRKRGAQMHYSVTQWSIAELIEPLLCRFVCNSVISSLQECLRWVTSPWAFGKVRIHVHKHTNMLRTNMRTHSRVGGDRAKLYTMSLGLLNQTKNLPSMNGYKWVATWAGGWDHSWGGIWRTALWWAAGLVREGRIFSVEGCQCRNGIGGRAARDVRNSTLACFCMNLTKWRSYRQCAPNSCTTFTLKAAMILYSTNAIRLQDI